MDHTQHACVFVQMYMSRRTQRCYPSKRRLLRLSPGIILAVIGMCIFAFAETESNYPLTHSAWHLLMSLSIVFLLPDKKQQLKGINVKSASFIV